MKIRKTATIFFTFTKPNNFSGQTAASELIINTLSAKGIKCIRILLYPLSRIERNPLIGYIKLIYKQISSIPNLLRFAFFRKPILHLNLGQSYLSFLRVAIWFFPIRSVNRGTRVVTSLHGSIFMLWSPESKTTRLFMKFLRASSIVTVLGENQKMKLVQLGLSPDKIRVVPNSCEMDVVTDSFILQKHNDEQSQINLLHLSLLIDSKGFPVYLDALEILAGMDLPKPVRAILCGPVASSAYCTRFRNAEEKRAWIEMKVEEINRISNKKLTVEWIHGARGKAKQRLYVDSHIFVLPTTFPVEAQPIVLLEALASGCSIITTTAGEIPSTLNKDCAVFIEKPDSQRLALDIYELINSPGIRISMAINGAKLIRGQLSLESHIAQWEKIFDDLRN